MRGLAVLALVAVAGCFSPKPQPGSPCDEDHPCPASLVCTQGLCERPGTEALDAGEPDGPVLTACVPTGFEICGDGIDQDCVDGDAVCEVNDKPAAAIDVTAGGMWMADLMRATDDLANIANTGCNNDGGREVFYQVTLDAPQAYYFDTFGSGFDTSVRVFGAMACTAVTGAMMPTTCSDDACATGESQLVASLPAGTSCVVLDQNANQATGNAILRVIPGGRTGTKLPLGMATLKGDTCTGTDRNDSPRCGEDGAKDLAYWFVACPAATATLDATTCADNNTTGFDSVLAVHKAGGAELVCNDDGGDNGTPACMSPDNGSNLVAVAARGPGLFWLIVDGFEARCGNFQLDTRLR